MEPSISVVVATYAPGAGFDRVMSSIDAQTIPPDRFELIVVDDGSPDDTVDRLRALAATRPFMRVERIENSGWPSRPRNVGTDLARAPYVLYMDHDDSLYPDALQRLADFAEQTRADVVSPKESKTSDAWWGLSSLRDGNVLDAAADGGIDRLLPMVPHKLYRRAFLAEHGIRFPEGRRRLWEDISVNVEAWARAARVSVLADTPVYLWQSSTANSSKTYGPRDAEYWDRLDDLLADIDGALAAEVHAAARKSVLLHQYRGRVLTRLSAALVDSPSDRAAHAVDRARAIRARYLPDAWEAELAQQDRARSLLLAAGRADLLAAMWTVDSDSAVRVRADEARWDDGALELDLTAIWTSKGGRPLVLREHHGRLLRLLPAEVLAALPEDAVDATASVFELEVAVRDRAGSISWSLPVEGTLRYEQVEGGRSPVVSATARIEEGVIALLRPQPHDVVARVTWGASQRAGSVRYGGRALPAALDGRPAVAYRSLRGGLSLDLSATLRNPIADGGIADAPLEAEHGSPVLRLPRVAVHGRTTVEGGMRLQAAGGAVVSELRGEFRAADGRAVLVLPQPPAVPDGTYEARFRYGDGAWLGPRPAVVARGTVHLHPPAPAVGTPTPRAPARRVLAALRRRFGRVLKRG